MHDGRLGIDMIKDRGGWGDRMHSTVVQRWRVWKKDEKVFREETIALSHDCVAALLQGLLYCPQQCNTSSREQDCGTKS